MNNCNLKRYYEESFLSSCHKDVKAQTYFHFTTKPKIYLNNNTNSEILQCVIVYLWETTLHLYKECSNIGFEQRTTPSCPPTTL